MAERWERILDALPQTQCTRCGYADCQGYAQAIDQGLCAINQCPPGGEAGVARLAQITDTLPIALSPAHGQEGARMCAVVEEDACIGCTLCMLACPVDAIIGSNKRMHTVIESHCTGCALCVPACPVDCIVLQNASGHHTGWDAWSEPQAQAARQRYGARKARLAQQAGSARKPDAQRYRPPLAQ